MPPYVIEVVPVAAVLAKELDSFVRKDDNDEKLIGNVLSLTVVAPVMVALVKEEVPPKTTFPLICPFVIDRFPPETNVVFVVLVA
jgi:hypothetical protein